MGVQFLSHHPDALHELRQALEGVVLALYRNEDLIRAGQGVERQKIEGRWAIEEHPVVRLRRKLLQGPFELELASQARHQLHLGPHQVNRGGRDVQPRDVRLDGYLLQGLALEQDVVHAPPGIRDHTETARGVPLRVHVYDEDLFALLGEGGRQVDGGGALPHTALLVDYGDHGFHRKHVSTRPARLSSYTTPSGRLAGTPTLRGYLAGVSSSFSRITRHRSFSSRPGKRGTRMTRDNLAPSNAAALSPSASSSPSSLPFMEITCPPALSSGTQYSATTESRATARAVATS